jgi:TolB protein
MTRERPRHRTRASGAAVALVTVAATILGGLALVTSQPVHAGSFPGENGRIAFQTSQDVPGGGRQVEIGTVAAGGSDFKNLTPEANLSGRYPDWSADGTRIAFAGTQLSPSRNAEVYVMNGDGSAKQGPLTDLNGIANPSWSPDGTMIAFETERSAGGNVFVLELASRAVSQVTQNTTDFSSDSQPAWSPDGGRIAYRCGARRSEDPYGICVINVDGTNSLRITNTYDEDPSWSPDGRQIVYEGGSVLNVVNADGTNSHPITTRDFNPDDPSWSPDGTKVVYVGSSVAHSALYTVNVDGTGNEQLTHLDEGVEYASWGRAPGSLPPTTTTTAPSTTSTTSPPANTTTTTAPLTTTTSTTTASTASTTTTAPSTTSTTSPPATTTTTTAPLTTTTSTTTAPLTTTSTTQPPRAGAAGVGSATSPTTTLPALEVVKNVTTPARRGRGTGSRNPAGSAVAATHPIQNLLGSQVPGFSAAADPCLNQGPPQQVLGERITNGNAENPAQGSNGYAGSDVPPIGWKTSGRLTQMLYGPTGGSLPTAQDPGPPSRGNSFFTAKSSGEFAFASAEQFIDVSGGSCLIDTGNVGYKLAGWLGGNNRSGKPTMVFVYFLDGGGSRLGAASIQTPASNQPRGLFRKELSGLLPAHTRGLVVRLGMPGDCELGCKDAAGRPQNFLYVGQFVDNVSVSLDPPADQLKLDYAVRTCYVGPCGETGSEKKWKWTEGGTIGAEVAAKPLGVYVANEAAPSLAVQVSLKDPLEATQQLQAGKVTKLGFQVKITRNPVAQGPDTPFECVAQPIAAQAPVCRDLPISAEVVYTTPSKTTVHFGYDALRRIAPGAFTADITAEMPDGASLEKLSIETTLDSELNAGLALLGGAEQGDRMKREKDRDRSDSPRNIAAVSVGFQPAPMAKIRLVYERPPKSPAGDKIQKIEATVSADAKLDAWLQTWDEHCPSSPATVQVDVDKPSSQNNPVLDPTCSGTVLHATGDSLQKAEKTRVQYASDELNAFRSVELGVDKRLALDVIVNRYLAGYRSEQIETSGDTGDAQTIRVERRNATSLNVTPTAHGSPAAIKWVQFAYDSPLNSSPPPRNASARNAPLSVGSFPTDTGEYVRTTEDKQGKTLAVRVEGLSTAAIDWGDGFSVAAQHQTSAGSPFHVFMTQDLGLPDDDILHAKATLPAGEIRVTYLPPDLDNARPGYAVTSSGPVVPVEVWSRKTRGAGFADLMKSDGTCSQYFNDMYLNVTVTGAVAIGPPTCGVSKVVATGLANTDLTLQLSNSSDNDRVKEAKVPPPPPPPGDAPADGQFNDVYQHAKEGADTYYYRLHNLKSVDLDSATSCNHDSTKCASRFVLVLDGGGGWPLYISRYATPQGGSEDKPTTLEASVDRLAGKNELKLESKSHVLAASVGTFRGVDWKIPATSVTEYTTAKFTPSTTYKERPSKVNVTIYGGARESLKVILEAPKKADASHAADQYLPDTLFVCQEDGRLARAEGACAGNKEMVGLTYTDYYGRRTFDTDKRTDGGSLLVTAERAGRQPNEPALHLVLEDCGSCGSGAQEWLKANLYVTYFGKQRHTPCEPNKDKYIFIDTNGEMVWGTVDSQGFDQCDHTPATSDMNFGTAFSTSGTSAKTRFLVYHDYGNGCGIPIPCTAEYNDISCDSSSTFRSNTHDLKTYADFCDGPDYRWGPPYTGPRPGA